MADQYRDKIWSIVKMKGAVLPALIASELKIDSMIASAMLSEMSSNGTLKISHIKIGSSPLYYDPTRPEVLEQYTSSLKSVERETLLLLKTSKVLRDGSLSPLARVAFQGLKDFAIPLDVTIGNSKEVFWKWYLLADKDAESIIVEMIEGPRKEIEPAQSRDTQQDSEPEKPKKKSPGRPKKIVTESPARQEKLSSIPERTPQISKNEKKIEQKQESRSKMQEVRSKTQDEKSNLKHSVLQESSFGASVASFLKVGGIQIVDVSAGKSGKEFDLVLKVPSPIGSLLMYSKAKEKKKINDADLSVAFVEGQLKNLPVIFLSNGVLDKGLDTELEKKYKGLVFKTI